MNKTTRLGWRCVGRGRNRRALKFYSSKKIYQTILEKSKNIKLRSKNCLIIKRSSKKLSDSKEIETEEKKRRKTEYNKNITSRQIARMTF